MIAVEDPEFDKHMGVNISKGQGLTTITSAIATNVYFYGKELDGISEYFQRFYKSVFECCKRVDFGRDVMAIVLNAKLTKEQQLSVFLHKTYMGHDKGNRITGFYEASMHYYKKPLSELTDYEFIGLVAMPIAPNTYNPQKSPELHRDRVKRISRLISGVCRPSGWLDLLYQNCLEKT